MECPTVGTWVPLLDRMLRGKLRRFGCYRYRHDEAAMLLLQRVPAAAASAFEALHAFGKETTYAAAFPCICCGQLHFSSHVVLAKHVENLSTLDGLGRFCLQENLSDSRFLAHGNLWLCRSCKTSVDRGCLPAMAMKNHLSAPWASPVNSCLNDLSNVEREVLSAGWCPFQKVRI